MQGLGPSQQPGIRTRQVSLRRFGHEFAGSCSELGSGRVGFPVGFRVGLGSQKARGWGLELVSGPRTCSAPVGLRFASTPRPVGFRTVLSSKPRPVGTILHAPDESENPVVHKEFGVSSDAQETNHVLHLTDWLRTFFCQDRTPSVSAPNNKLLSMHPLWPPRSQRACTGTCTRKQKLSHEEME